MISWLSFYLRESWGRKGMERDVLGVFSYMQACCDYPVFQTTCLNDSHLLLWSPQLIEILEKFRNLKALKFHWGWEYGPESISQLQTGKQWPNTFQRLENKRWSGRGTERGNRRGEKGTSGDSDKSNDGKITFSSLNYLYSKSKWYIIWWSRECSLLLK